MARVRYLGVGLAKRVGLESFPNFSASGSIRGMKDMYYGKNALLVKSGGYIYNVSSKPKIYAMSRWLSHAPSFQIHDCISKGDGGNPHPPHPTSSSFVCLYRRKEAQSQINENEKVKKMVYRFHIAAINKRSIESEALKRFGDRGYSKRTLRHYRPAFERASFLERKKGFSIYSIPVIRMRKR